MRFRTFLLVLRRAAPRLLAQTYSPSLYSGMRWRQVGPFRAGRISAVAEFRATRPFTIWARRAAASGRAPAAAHLEADLRRDSPGIHRVDRHRALQSQHPLRGHGRRQQRGEIGQYRQRRVEVVDAGAHWQHLGLDDTHHVVSLVVDPKNPDIVLAAALGHTYARNEDRGVFRTTDGGRRGPRCSTRATTLGAVNMVADPDNPQTIFAALEVYLTVPECRPRRRGRRRGRGEGRQRRARASTNPPIKGLTWTYLSGHGLPDSNMGRIGLAVAAAPADSACSR
jgi:hypothetical protein